MERQIKLLKLLFSQSEFKPAAFLVQNYQF